MTDRSNQDQPTQPARPQKSPPPPLPGTPQPRSSYYDGAEHGKFKVFAQQDGVNTSGVTDPLHGGTLYLRAPGTVANPDDPADAKTQADRANGDIASNQGISFNSGARVFGDAKPGPGADNDPSTTGDNYSVSGLNGGNWAHGETSVLDANLVVPLPTFTTPGSSTVVAGVPTHGSAPSYNSSTQTWNFAAAGSNPQIVLSSLELNSNTTLNIKGTTGQVIDIYVTGNGEEVIKLNSSCHINITDALGNAGYERGALDPENPNLQGPRVRIWTNGGISLNSRATRSSSCSFPRRTTCRRRRWSTTPTPLHRPCGTRRVARSSSTRELSTSARSWAATST